MRLVALETGRINANMAIFTGEDRRGALPVASWLVEHQRGRVLFDTGLHQELQLHKDRLGPLARGFDLDFPAGEELSARLAQRGIGPDEIDVAVFSHLHFDHAGGTAELPDARLVVQRDEWESARRDDQPGVYNPADFDLGHDVQLIEGAHDLFGDGRIVCVPTPGHTVGHQSLRVALDSGPVVLTGDCVYVASMLDAMAVPAFGHDVDQQRASMRELRRLRDDEGCHLLFGHDEGQLRALPADGLT